MKSELVTPSHLARKAVVYIRAARPQATDMVRNDRRRFGGHTQHGRPRSDEHIAASLNRMSLPTGQGRPGRRTASLPFDACVESMPIDPRKKTANGSP